MKVIETKNIHLYRELLEVCEKLTSSKLQNVVHEIFVAYFVIVGSDNFSQVPKAVIMEVDEKITNSYSDLQHLHDEFKPAISDEEFT